MTEHTIGKCSICGGNVIVIYPWMGVEEQTPRCKKCRAKKKQNLPVVDMEPNESWRKHMDLGIGDIILDDD